MKKNCVKTIVTALTITVIVGAFAGCGSKKDNVSSGAISGTITATGSTALKPLAEEIAKNFVEKNPNATVNIQGGGSGTGLKDAAAGNVELGMSDVLAEEKLPEDQAKELVDHKVCVVGFAPVANSKVKVDSLTKQQLIDIFTGKITNWKEVGGDDLKIIILSRPKSSGTRATFKKYALDGKEEAEGKSLTQESSGSIAKTIKETEGSISYLASSYLISAANREGLKVLKFNGVEMNKVNITSGKYDIWSYEHIYTKGEAKGVAKAYLDYMNSKEITDVILRLGYIPTSEMQVKR